jgi:leucyl aminopeptidase
MQEETKLLSINFVSQAKEDTASVILVDTSLTLGPDAMLLDQNHQGLISKTVNNKHLFTGKFGQKKILTTSGSDGSLQYLMLVGIGELEKLTKSKIEEIGGKILKAAKCAKISGISVLLRGNIGAVSSSEAAALIASGALLASYKFDKYFTNQKEDEKFIVENFYILTNDQVAAEEMFAEYKAVALGVCLARDCINEPGNVLYPASYADIIYQELDPLGIDVNILGEREMKNLGMGALLGVGQGSQNESKLVVMKYMGADDSTAPIALVGKGVTFDTGGISLKPSNGMWEMKYDMSGSAAVVGAIKALSLRKSKVNVVGVVGLVENMPGGNAQRPGDVVHTMSGKTAEVLDTDAEGRLVLADAVWYAQTEFKPSILIDLATLTGAIVVALGKTYAGLFANDDLLAQNLINSGAHVDEKLWRMPLHEDYDEMIKSNIADVANLGNQRGQAGSSTAAHFIGRFIQEGVKWAHLDIAGTAWNNNPTGICPKGAVGFGVRLLNQFIKDHYESK